MSLPRHLAIIMDGNGRWAEERSLPRVEGHRIGALAVHRTVRSCRELGIGYLTLYAFSAQNWARPSEEVGALMQLLLDYIHRERREILDNDIRLKTIGDTDNLPSFVRLPLRALISESANNRGMVLTLALSYGGREELVRAARTLAFQVDQGERLPDDIDAEAFEAALYTSGQPDPDLLIRTSGEERLSNFLLWQLAYTELHFVPVCWPDFDREHLDIALRRFATRERRFGKTSAQVSEPSTGPRTTSDLEEPPC